jgi:pimeloyl-ACP methyl ester carboxylesterase
VPTVSKLRLPGFAERRLTVARTALRYDVCGAGPPLVLVHGLGGAAVNWLRVAPALAAERRVIVPDLPGHAGSAPFARGQAPSLDRYADALLELLEAERALPAPWVGHSLGGVLALRAAVRAPAAVSGVVLAAAAGISSSARAAEVVLTVLAVVRPGRLVARRRAWFAHTRTGRSLAFGWWGAADPARLDPEVAEAFLAGPLEHRDLRSAGAALVAGDPRADLDRVSCPCLCLWGGEDNWVPLQDGMEYARRLRAPLRVVADAGHLLIGERPDAVVAAIRDFVAGLPQR